MGRRLHRSGVAQLGGRIGPASTATAGPMPPTGTSVESAPLPIRLGGSSQQPLQGMRWHNRVGTVGERLLHLLPNVITATPTAPATRPFPAPVIILRSPDIITPTLSSRDPWLARSTRRKHEHGSDCAAACHAVHGLAMQPRLAKGGWSMQIIWMVTVTLVLALSGVLALALAAHVADRAKRRSPRASPPTAQPPGA